jgi:Mor family transcriptional regulator
MDKSCKSGELQPESFGNVIDRAIERDGSNRCSLAKKWNASPETLYRYQNKGHSPKFDDLCEMVKRMNPAERQDLAIVLFGKKLTDLADIVGNEACEAAREKVADLRESVKRMSEALATV